MSGPIPPERSAPAPFELRGAATGLAPLDGARILASVVVNLEHWSLDAPMPRAALPAPHGLTVVPDVANHSWVLYGLRVGLPRLAEALAPLGDRVTAAVNAEVVDHYPAVAQLIDELGWEVVAHGLRQRYAQTYDDESSMIAETLVRLGDRFDRPRGWLGPGMNQTDETLGLLVEHGVEFTHDWMIDDRPVWLDGGVGSILGIPYTLSLNDVTAYVVEHQPDGALADRVRRTLDVLRREIVHDAVDDGAVVMPIGLHPHVMGVAHRIDEVRRIVDDLVGADDVVPCRSSEIHDWYSAQVPCPESRSTT